ncbi:hypothetical protein GGS21DRAFT_148635 [Xylaria nigripes]|nr:hypothetical protein GGS21DRAFT_148635 [Xylaria nigripes]
MEISSAFTSSSSPQQPLADPLKEDDNSVKPIEQSETNIVSRDQLLADVKSIYAGLAMVEALTSAFDRCRMAIEDDDIEDCRHQMKLIGHQQPHQYTEFLYNLPILGDRSHGSPSIEPLKPNIAPDGECHSHPNQATTPHTSSVKLPLKPNPDSYELWSNRRSFTLKPCLERPSKQLVKICILSCMFALACTASASVASRRTDYSLHSRQLEAPSNDSNDKIAQDWFFHLIYMGIFIAQFIAAHIVKEPLVVHGVSMAFYGAAFLLMVFGQTEVHFNILFSIWFMDTITTVIWICHDLKSVDPNMRKPAVLFIIVMAILLDSGISGLFASISNSASATKEFAVFLVPCIGFAAFLRSGIQSLYRQVKQPV